MVTCMYCTWLQVKCAAKQDRELFEKGERAFVSYVAGYQEVRECARGHSSPAWMKFRGVSQRCWIGRAIGSSES
eukprot:COSAG01_NODE_27_length_36706_cov_155.674106_18_plen_74_part_00